MIITMPKEGYPVLLVTVLYLGLGWETAAMFLGALSWAIVIPQFIPAVWFLVFLAKRVRRDVQILGLSASLYLLMAIFGFSIPYLVR